MNARQKGIGILCLFFFLWGCQTAYYAAWEKLGKEKRHLLKDQVENAREDQEEAAEQFKDVLTRIKEAYGFDGGELESFYSGLKSNYEECEQRAEELNERIDKIERIADDLFNEWESEIDQIETPAFRKQSQLSLMNTKKRYAALNKALVQSESGMRDVLKNLQDYVLYLKHNLNAMAIGALKNEADSIASEINSLISKMNRSIREADEFLKTI